MANLESLQAKLDYQFRDPSLLQLALTHPSLAHEPGGNPRHNQRLEFLGDSVLQLVITAELYNKFPEAGEGVLTKARAQMVGRRTLAAQGRQLEMGEHLLLSRGEASTGGRGRTSTLADAFEALVGAIYLDGGFEQARTFILAQFHNAFGELHALPNLENPKGELQEILQSNSSEPPRYRLESVAGPDHDRVFISAVFHQGKELGKGEGKSKKEAESQAASAALARLRLPANEPAPTPAAGAPHA